MRDPAAGMTVKRLAAAACVCCLGLVLGSCSELSDGVADHWPHFAGGEPDNLPPRPGAPGYNKFIAHGQPTQGAESPVGKAQPAATAAIANPKPGGTDQAPTAFTAPQNQTSGAQQPPTVEKQRNNSNDVQGGLY